MGSILFKNVRRQCLCLALASLMFVSHAAQQRALNETTTVKKSDFSECGVKGGKGCWLMPGECQEHNSCHSVVTWRKGSNELVIEFDTTIDDLKMPILGKYAAVGFSDDYKMGNDFVIECVANPSGRVHAYLSYNDGVANSRCKVASKLLLHNTSGTVQNGRFYCQTTLILANLSSPNIPPDEQWKIIDISKPPSDYYLLFAKGNADPETDTLMMHWLLDGDLFPWIATEKTDVVNSQVKTLRSAKHYDIPRSIQYKLVQAHGIMMIIGWWIFAAVATFLARNFKPLWPDRKLCGVPVWFQLHRALMIISLILQCSAFALIFIQNGTLITCTRACDTNAYKLMLHAYLGIACTAGALIQPFMALLRPNPASPKRPIFAWLHWFVGSGSFITATITIFLSAELGKAGLRHNYKYIPDYVMAGYVLAFIACSIAFEILWYIRYRPVANSGRIQLSSMSGPKAPVPATVSDVTEKRSYTVIQIAVLVFFIIAAVSLCATLAYFITSHH